MVKLTIRRDTRTSLSFRRNAISLLIILPLLFGGDRIQSLLCLHRFQCIGFVIVPRHVTISSSSLTESQKNNFLRDQEVQASSTTRTSTIRSRKNVSSSRLYGIKGFRGWFEATFPSAMTEIDNVDHSDEFDHVLIDVNQLLHIALRRAKNEGHALTMVLKELDKCLDQTRPKKSVVLAFDGPPSAAKLATQRRRRYGTVVRAELKRERIKFLEDRIKQQQQRKKQKTGGKQQSQKIKATLTKNNGGGKEEDLLTIAAESFLNQKRRKRKNYDRLDEEATLCITPGTKFMEKAANALLYWSWQRMINPRSRVGSPGVRVYLSTSEAPGEGEVKLLDWVFQMGSRSQNSFTTNNDNNSRKTLKQVIAQGDSIAIMGGDSDLVLEGLILPPTITHNVFVILPNGSKKSYSVSLWETTRQLLRYLPKLNKPSDIMKVRTDLVLLLIMNGNDYLPKLRGSSGFNKLFHTYLRVLKQTLDKNPDEDHNESFLVSPDLLSFNKSFCLRFFRTLAKSAPKLVDSVDMLPYQKSITPLSNLNIMIDSGFIPKPATFKVRKMNKLDSNLVDVSDDLLEEEEETNISDEDDDYDTEGEEEEDIEPNNINGSDTKHQEVVQLILGDPSSKSTPSFIFEVSHRRGKTALKSAKHKLAAIALEEILGSNWRDLNDYSLGNDDDDFESGFIIGDGSSQTNNNGGTPTGYSWEINGPVECDVEQYLAGMLWNLQTYQDGVCADYSYNYGRRMSPTASQIVQYLENSDKNSPYLGRETLLSNTFTGPLNAGLSCLAALPAQAKHLVPEPYRILTENQEVEEIYGDCMDPNCNVFDIQLFEKKCMKSLAELSSELSNNNNKNDIKKSNNPRKIKTGDNYWTVLSHTRKDLAYTFDPPEPFSDRLSYLRSSKRIQVTKLWATSVPKWISMKRKRRKDSRRNRASSTNQIEQSKGYYHEYACDDDHYDVLDDIHNLGFKVAYIDAREEALLRQHKTPKNNIKKKKKKKLTSPKVEEINGSQSNGKVVNRAKEPSSEQKRLDISSLNTPAQILQILVDARCLPDPVKYDVVLPSDNNENGVVETVRLRLFTDENKKKPISSYEIQREVNGSTKRKQLKHDLATRLLNDVLGPDSDWKEKSIEELKQCFVEQSSVF